MKRIEDEVPELVKDRYVRMIVEVKHCLVCKRPLLPKLGEADPRFFAANAEAQWQRAGWPEAGPYIASERGYVCKPCAESGAACWTCALCKERKRGQPQESVGDPPENLCVDCFATVPAKQWAEKIEQLEEAHRYDHC